MPVLVDIYTSERRIYHHGRLVSRGPEDSYRPIRAEDFMAPGSLRHVVTACERPRHQVLAPDGTRLEPGLGAYRMLIPRFGAEHALKAGALLYMGKHGLYGCVIAPKGGPLVRPVPIGELSLFGAEGGAL